MISNIINFFLNTSYPWIWIILLIFVCYVMMVQVWVYYLIVMKFKAVRDRNAIPDSLFVKFHGYLIMALGIPLYIFLNLTVGTLLFLDLPREVQFTGRCQRYIAEGEGFLQRIDFVRKTRQKMAKWICVNALDPFEEGGHC